MTEAKPVGGLKQFALHLEFSIVMGLGLCAVVGTMMYYSGKQAELLSDGHKLLVSKLETMNMTDSCGGASNNENACLTIGNYRVKKTGDHAWSVSEVGREAALEGQEVMSVTETGMFINTLVPLKQERRLRREIVKAVTGQTLTEIAAAKSQTK